MSREGIASVPARIPEGGPAGRRRGDFVARNVAGVTSALEHALFNEEQARRPGLLQGRDARAKVLSALVLLLAVAFLRHLPAMGMGCVLVMGLAKASRLPLLAFARRAWLGASLFAGMIILPSLFITPGSPLVTLIDVPPLRLAISDNGLAAAARFVARVGTSVSVALLLISTTPWADLLRALRVLKVPDSFLAVLAMTYRYLFQFLRSANNLFLARSSRTVGESSGAEQRRWAAAATGALASRSLKLSGDVLMAMRARGFAGEIRSRRAPTMGDEDWLLLASAVVIAAALLMLDGGLG